jgi:hypothetical protein
VLRPARDDRSAARVVRDPARDVDGSEGIEVDWKPAAHVEGPRRGRLRGQQARSGVSTAADTHGRTAVVSLVPSARRLYPGRAPRRRHDGLILLTDDGALAHRLTHPSFEVPRTYHAKVRARRRCARGAASAARGGRARRRRHRARRACGGSRPTGRDHHPRGPQAPGAAHARRGRAPGGRARARALRAAVARRSRRARTGASRRRDRDASAARSLAAGYAAPPMRLIALRGATTVDANEAEPILTPPRSSCASCSSATGSRRTTS